MLGPSELSESADSSIGVGDESLLAEGILLFGQGVGGHALRHLEEDAAGVAKRRIGESGGCRYTDREARQQSGVNVDVGSRSGVSVRWRFGCCDLQWRCGRGLQRNGGGAVVDGIAGSWRCGSFWRRLVRPHARLCGAGAPKQAENPDGRDRTHVVEPAPGTALMSTQRPCA